MAEQEDRAKAYERAWILDIAGPGRWVIVVPKWLRDAVLLEYGLKPEDVPGLVELCPPGELGRVDGVVVRTAPSGLLQTPPAPPVQKPLPYPPRLRGRYAR